MRRAVLVLASALLAGGAIAQTAGPRPHRYARNVLFLDQASPSFVIPVVGNTPGANGEHWRSQVVISNFRDVQQRVRITLLPHVNSGVASRSVFVTLPTFENGGYNGLVSTDFLGTQLAASGLAAVRVEAVDVNGNPDPSGLLDGTSRIYTRLANGGPGSASMSLLSVRNDHLTGSSFSAFALGMQHDANFRTNVGIVNLSNVTQTFRVDAFGTIGELTMNVTVPPNSLNQVSLPAGNIGTATITFTMTSGSGNWTAYAASVDNGSGDGWVRTANF